MRDVYEVLPAKEILVEQLRREIEALRLVAPLLNDDRDNGSLTDPRANRKESDAQNVRSVERRGGTRWPKQDRESAMVTEEATLGTAQKISGRLKRLARPVLDAVNSMASEPKDRLNTR